MHCSRWLSADCNVHNSNSIHPTQPFVQLSFTDFITGGTLDTFLHPASRFMVTTTMLPHLKMLFETIRVRDEQRCQLALVYHKVTLQCRQESQSRRSSHYARNTFTADAVGRQICSSVIQLTSRSNSNTRPSKWCMPITSDWSSRSVYEHAVHGRCRSISGKSWSNVWYRTDST